MKSKILRSDVLLSTQRALLGCITSNMFAITIGFTESKYKLRVYFKKEPTDLELELLKDISGEVSADIHEFNVFEEEAFIAGSKLSTSKLEMLDAWVYMQYNQDDA